MTEKLKQAERALDRMSGYLPRVYKDDIEIVRRALTAAQPAQAGEVDERAAFIEWLETTWPKCYPKGTGADYWRNGHLSALAWKAARASLPTQPAAQSAKPDLSGHDAFDVLSQGYPTHPADCRCTWCKGKPAAQATPEPVGEPTEGEFFAWDAEGGIAFYKARQEAINHAKESLRYYRDGANNHGEWDEDVEHIRWGVVMQRAEATNISATEDGESSCDYELQDVATHPAPGVPDGEPKLTQEELLEVAKHAWLMARTADSLQFYRTLLSAAAQAKGGGHD